MCTTDILKHYLAVLNQDSVDTKLVFNVQKTLLKDFVYIIETTDLRRKRPFNSHNNFFIKENGKYIGIVMGGECNLLWYLAEEYRCNGIMTRE